MADAQNDINTLNAPERRILMIALGLNIALFLLGMVAALISHSAGLMADSLDMLADAIGYSISLVAIGRTARFKSWAAGFSGAMLMLLGVGLLLEVGRRFYYGSEPVGQIMIGMACFSFLVNLFVLKMLKPFRQGEIHLRAAWKETKADVLVNLGVIVSGILVVMMQSRYPDLVIGLVVGFIVIEEAWEILEEAREAHAVALKK